MVNVNDFSDIDLEETIKGYSEGSGNVLQAMFNRQTELMEKYESIEKKLSLIHI